MTRALLLGLRGSVMATAQLGDDGTATFAVPARTTVAGFQLTTDDGRLLYVSDSITERYQQAGTYTVTVTPGLGEGPHAEPAPDDRDARIAAALALHPERRRGTCPECGMPTPCATRLALTGGSTP